MFWGTAMFLAPAGIRIPDIQSVTFLLHYLHCVILAPQCGYPGEEKNLVVVVVAAEEVFQFYT